MESTLLVDAQGGQAMPGGVLYVLFGALVLTTALMRFLPTWWKPMLLAALLGGAFVPLALRSLPFWTAFYAPWLLGVLYGSITGRLAREEQLTALLLIASAVGAAVLPVVYYREITQWTPPWCANDVFVITLVEAVNLLITTWLVAALLLGLLALIVLLPVNLLVPVTHSARSDVNTWFKERTEIVFGILGVISYVGSSAAERNEAKVRYGINPGDDRSSRR